MNKMGVFGEQAGRDTYGEPVRHTPMIELLDQNTAHGFTAK